jgi:ubiquinone/menaquinone biosynthesis C-methylase UbiE
MDVNEEVKNFWEEEACGTSPELIKEEDLLSKSWYEEIEDYRYSVEPFIHSIAKFTTHDGKKVLEIGVGAGTDHMNWAKSNVELYGVDLTDRAIETTRKRLEIYGLKSNLQRTNAESLPFEDDFFDIVYSWGVIHHSEDISKIISEISRVLKPKGKFLGMIYHRRSLHTLWLWIKNAFLKGRPWRSAKYVIYHFNESIATKAYTVKETKFLFKDFKECHITPFLTEADFRFFKSFRNFFPEIWGFYLGIEATKEKASDS